MVEKDHSGDGIEPEELFSGEIGEEIVETHLLERYYEIDGDLDEATKAIHNAVKAIQRVQFQEEHFENVDYVELEDAISELEAAWWQVAEVYTEVMEDN